MGSTIDGNEKIGMGIKSLVFDDTCGHLIQTIHQSGI